MTNIASVSEETKNRIVSEPHALSTIQYLQFSDHELLEAAWKIIVEKLGRLPKLRSGGPPSLKKRGQSFVILQDNWMGSETNDCDDNDGLNEKLVGISSKHAICQRKKKETAKGMVL
ncbi:hypothetical protein ABG067_006753 [Albugo candida]